MGARKTVGEAAVRFVLFCAAVGLLRWAVVARQGWQEDFSSSFELSWDGWAGWIALVAGVGIVAGLACLPARPAGYRWHIPLVTTLPALLLLGHFVLVFENTDPGGADLPWILDHVMFYMDVPAQFVLAALAGFGLTAGLRPRTEQRAEAEPAQS